MVTVLLQVIFTAIGLFAGFMADKPGGSGVFVEALGWPCVAFSGDRYVAYMTGVVYYSLIGWGAVLSCKQPKANKMICLIALLVFHILISFVIARNVVRMGG